MNNLPKQLQEMCIRDRKIFPGDEEFGGFINYTDVITGYYFLVDYFGQLQCEEKMLVGIKDENMIASALGRQTISFCGKRKWTDPLDIGATLFFGLDKNHGFHDGNKRIALLMLLLYLYKNNRWIDCKKK